MTLLFRRLMQRHGSQNAPGRGRRRSLRRGFALMATLMMMVLLVLLAVGLLSLSTVSLRGSDHQRLVSIAQANARMALIMAIGELQKEVGPDQRITATSNILETSGANIQHPFLTGVWNSRDYSKQNPLDNDPPAIVYEPEKAFRRWLVSANDPQDLIDTDFARTGRLQDPIELVGERKPASAPASLGTGTTIPAVQADRILVQGASAQEKGKFAWWVGDENCKGFLNPTASEHQTEKASKGDILASTQTPGAYGMEAVDEKFPANTEDSAKVLTHGQAALASTQGRDATAAWFHDLSPFPRSVLTNVTKGGLRQDLSLFLEQSSLDSMPAWPSTNEGSLPSGPLGPNGKIALSIEKDEPNGAKGYDVLAWKQLAAWWRLRHSTKLDMSTGRPSLVARAGKASATVDDYLNPRWNSGTLRPAPVPIRYLLFASYGTVDPTGSGQLQLRIYLYPVVVLWNPYNIDIKTEQLNVLFNNMPLKYDIFKNDSFADTYNWHYWTGVQPYFNEPQTIKAGETMIFAPVEWKWDPDSQDGNHIAHKMAPSPILYTRKPGIAKGSVGAGGTWGGGATRYDTPINVSGTKDERLKIKPILKAFAGKSLGENTFAIRTHHLSIENQEWNLPFLWHSTMSWRFETKTPWTPNKTAPVEDTFGAVQDAPRPFMVVDIKLKTLDETEIPSKTWSHNIPGHPFQGFTDVGGKAPIFLNAYKMTFNAVSEVEDVLEYLQLSSPNQTYFGSSNFAKDGQQRITDVEIPLAPLTSLAQLQNLPQGSIDNLYSSGFFFQNHAIGNSFANPGVKANAVKSDDGWPFWMDPWLSGGVPQVPTHAAGTIRGERSTDLKKQFYTRPNIDRSYAANHLLWDDYFFSSIAPKDGALFTGASAATLAQVVNDFYLNNKPLPNERYKPYFHKPAQQIIDDLVADGKPNEKSKSWEKAAGSLMVDGGFNVNSTSVDAWKTLLASAHRRYMTIMDSGSNSPTKSTSAGKYIVSRFTMPNGVGKAGEDLRWCGYRELTETQIDALAQAIVRQVKTRGPFLSLGDFINRRLGDDETDPLTRYGALQAALEDKNVDINEDYRGKAITAAMLKDVDYKNITAATGSKFEGAPCYVTQADLLGPIAPILNARSDTFVIRAYGEATGADGLPAARAWCEAVVQRVPDFLDNNATTGDKPETATANLQAPPNKLFGRRMQMVSFRWLSPHEI